MVSPASLHSQADNGGIAITNGDGSVNVTVETLAKVTSYLNPLIIQIIATYNPQESQEDEDADYPGVDEKIGYNAVAAYAEDLREYSGYMGIIENLIDNIDNEDPGAKSRFLWAIKKKYKQVKKELFIEKGIKTTDIDALLEIIKENSDIILLKVSKLIVANYHGSTNVSIEKIDAAKELIVCYGFINCKILEPPK